MSVTHGISRWARSALIGTATLAGCSGGAPSLPAADSASGSPAIARPAEPSDPRRCAAFQAHFNEFVACQRADGTLRSFADPQVAWRVRYYVRYLAMPCGEAPTVEEAYVFHAVIGDLSDDSNLDNTERTKIRSAMFAGKVPCSK
jgi:hypothetical protein